MAALGEDLDQVVGEVPAGEVDAHDGVRQRVPLVDRHGVGHPVAAVQHHPGRPPGGVEGQHGLDGDVQVGHVEGLEHDLGHALAVALRVVRGLGEQHGVLLRRDAELVVEGVVPDPLHVVPVRDDAVLDGVLQRQDPPLRLGLVAHVGLLLHADHRLGRRALRPPHQRGEHRPRRVVAREPRLFAASRPRVRGRPPPREPGRSRAGTWGRRRFGCRGGVSSRGRSTRCRQRGGGGGGGVTTSPAPGPPAPAHGHAHPAGHAPGGERWTVNGGR